MRWVLAENIDLRIKSLAHILGGQSVLAGLYGTTQPQVSRWIRGRAKPQKKRLEIMAKSQGWPLVIFEEGGPMPADIVRWPAGMELGHQGSPRGAAAPSSGVSHGGVDYSSSTENPDSDRPEGVPPLPEPVFPLSGAAWTSNLIVYKAGLGHLDQLERDGVLSPEARKEVEFWFKRLAVASQRDLAAALPAPTRPNGEQHAG
jgi:hypothetical protein